MAGYLCPSCGARYNGKRCRSCLYEHFTEEIAHGNHTHEGEPLVVDAPARKPIRRKNPFACEKRTKKKHPLAGFVVLLVIINALLPILRDWGLELEAMEDRFAAQPEPMAIPEDAMTLYADGDLRVLADWKNGQEYTDGIRIFVENDTGYDLTVSAEDIIVNGYMMDTAYFYCDVRDGTQSFATLRLDENALEYAGISVVEAISFYLDVWEQESYDPITTSQRIVLQAAPQGTDPRETPEGQLLYEGGAIRVSCLGYVADEYYPEELHEGKILFHIENDTARYLEVWTPAVRANGQDTELRLWCQLHPNTRAIGTMYLYELEELGLASLDKLELTLEFTDQEDYDFSEKSGTIVVDLG